MSQDSVPPALPPFAFPFAEESDRPTAYAALEAELPNPSAAILQRLLHEVLIWIRAPEAERRIEGDLPDTDVLPAKLASPVQRTFELLREEPDEHTVGAVTLGLIVVADWAEDDSGMLRTAVVFYQATLLVLGETVRVIYEIGRLLRRLSLFQDAEAWLRFTAERAAATRNWEHQVLALTSLGHLERERGNVRAAVQFHRRALARARAHKLRSREGDALYTLAVIAFQQGKVEEGIRWARGAIPAYGRGSCQLVSLAYDLAWIWLHQHGESNLALQIFQRIEPHVHAPPLRALLLALIARAAAEEGEAQIYELSWIEAYAFMRKQDDDEGHAAALSQLALAALASMQIERTREIATLAVRAAQTRRETRLAEYAEQIAEAVRDGLPEPEVMESLFPTFSLEEQPFDMDAWNRNEAFTAAITVALAARHDEAPESPVHDQVYGK